MYRWLFFVFVLVSVPIAAQQNNESMLSGQGFVCIETNNSSKCSNQKDWANYESKLSIDFNEKIYPLLIEEVLPNSKEKIKYELHETDQGQIAVYENNEKIGGGYSITSTDFQSIHIHFTFVIHSLLVDQQLIFSDSQIVRQGFASDKVQTYPRAYWRDTFTIPTIGQ